MKTYREQAEIMLERWGVEMAEGHGQANVLARVEEVGNGSGNSVVGAMFSPMAEKAEAIMQDIRRVDPGMYNVLLLRSLGMNVSEMTRSSGRKRHELEREVEEGLGAFAMAVYCRSRQRYWLIDPELRG